MTLGVIYDIIDAMELTDEFYSQYLRGAERRQGIFSWRHLKIADLPEYLKRIQQSGSIAHTTWMQLQKAIRSLVVCACDNQVCTLPDGWFIEVNTRNRRTLWCPEWKEMEVATRVVRRMTPDNATEERIQEWLQLQRAKKLLQQARQLLHPHPNRKRGRPRSQERALPQQDSSWSLPALSSQTS